MTIAAAIMVLSCPSAAAASDVASYLARIDALRARGPIAMLSSDYAALNMEIPQSSAALKQERLAALRNRHVPAYCPPPGASLDTGQVMAALHAVDPAARSRTAVKDALRAGFARKYPCR